MEQRRSVRNVNNGQEEQRTGSPSEPGIVTAILIVIAIALLIGVFLWTVAALNPWVTDFVPSESPDANSSGSASSAIGILSTAAKTSMRVGKVV